MNLPPSLPPPSNEESVVAILVCMVEGHDLTPSQIDTLYARCFAGPVRQQKDWILNEAIRLAGKQPASGPERASSGSSWAPGAEAGRILRTAHEEAHSEPSETESVAGPKPLDMDIRNQALSEIWRYMVRNQAWEKALQKGREQTSAAGEKVAIAYLRTCARRAIEKWCGGESLNAEIRSRVRRAMKKHCFSHSGGKRARHRLYSPPGMEPLPPRGRFAPAEIAGQIPVEPCKGKCARFPFSLPNETQIASLAERAMIAEQCSLTMTQLIALTMAAWDLHEPQQVVSREGDDTSAVEKQPSLEPAASGLLPDELELIIQQIVDLIEELDKCPIDAAPPGKYSRLFLEFVIWKGCSASGSATGNNTLERYCEYCAEAVATVDHRWNQKLHPAIVRILKPYDLTPYDQLLVRETLRRAFIHRKPDFVEYIPL